MQAAGISVDVKVLEDAGKEIKGYVDSLEKQVIDEAGEEFNVNSPKQLSEILFQKM